MCPHSYRHGGLGAYGWPHDIADEVILARLLALNLARAAGQGGAAMEMAEGSEDDES